MSIRLTLAAAAALTLGAMTMAMADEKAAPAKMDGTAPDCLQLYQIDHTEVIDDYTLLFHMKGGKTYVSKFPYRCHGLKFERGYAYSTSIPQICGNVDFITVIRRGNACPLGPFKLYTPEAKAKDKAPAEPAK